MKKYSLPSIRTLEYILITIFILTAAVFIQSWHTYIVSSNNAVQGIKQRLAYLKDSGNAIAASDQLSTSLKTNNSYETLSFLGQQKDLYHIGLLAVANTDGILTVRTVSNYGRGVNVFLATPQGRAVAKGVSTASVEKSLFDPQEIFLITARPVLDSKNMIGALFASENMDDTFAKRFKSDFLPAKTQIAFYSKDVGVYSSTFENESEKNLIRLYFNSNSDWITSNRSGDLIKFTNNKFYKVVNVPLQGLEQQTAGALVFVPIYPYLPLVTLLVCVSLVFFFVARRWLYHPHHRIKFLRHTGYIIILSVIGLFGTLVIVGLVYQKMSSIQAPPFTIYNSTLRFQPDSGVVSTDFDQSVQVV